ncbi:MAG: hypothetical protein VCA35_08150 [Roseibacillus sp.]
MISRPTGCSEAWTHVTSQSELVLSSIHGPDHWERVEGFGLYLSRRTGADPTVVSLFALFHDSRRESEGDDPLHGYRGANYALEQRGELFEVTDEQMTLLFEACEDHTEGHHHADPTVGTCWDSDRMDMTRCGVELDPAYFSTGKGREIASFGSWSDFHSARA